MRKDLRILLGLGCLLLIGPWGAGCSSQKLVTEPDPWPGHQRKISTPQERARDPISKAEWEELLRSLKMDYEESDQAKVEQGDAHYRFAERYFQAGDFEKAEIECEKAIKLNPNHAPAKALHLEIQFILGRAKVTPTTQEYDKYMKESLVRHQQVLIELDAAMARGNRYLKQGDAKAAEREFRRIREYTKWMPTGVESAKRAKEAGKQLKKMGVDDGSAPAQSGGPMFLKQSRGAGGGSRAWRGPTTRKGAAESRRFYDQALAHHAQGDFKSALNAAAQAVTAWPGNSAALKLHEDLTQLTLGGQPEYGARSMAEDELRSFKVKIEQAQIEITKHIRDGERYYNARMYEEAIREFQNAEFKIKAIPYDVPAMNELLPRVQDYIVKTRNAAILEGRRIEEDKRGMGEAESLVGDLKTKRETNRKVAELLEESYKAYERKEFDKAAGLADQVLKIDPQYSVAKEMKEDVLKTRHKEQYYPVLSKKIEAWKRLTDKKAGTIPRAQTFRYHPSPAKTSPKPKSPKPVAALDEKDESELVVIARKHGWKGNDRVLGGELRVRIPGEDRVLPMPLKHTDAKARITHYFASVTLTQEYHNPYDEKIEAVYSFPLPENGAVRDFVMTIGDRKIRGFIREREEAKRIYIAARSQGRTASLLVQERQNLFTQSVANIEPGKDVDITITYFHTLAYKDGEYEFVFPMVIGPRFNPPGSKNPVRALPVGASGSSRKGIEIEYVRPEVVTSHDISLEVKVDAGVAIESIESPSHEVRIERPRPHLAKVTLSPNDRIPNKDFILRYRAAGEAVKAGLATYRKNADGYFSLIIHPPASLENTPVPSREMIFVLDCSGSMKGQPIAAAKRSLERCLRRMRPADTFQIVRFSDNASRFGPTPIRATPENVRRGLEYLESLSGNGRTMMIRGVRQALDFPHDPRRLRVVSFMTDGHIGNEREIIHEVHRRLGSARIFSFGVGSAPNRYLLEGMAQAGRGVSAYITLDQASEEAADTLYRRVEHPALSGVRIDWGTLDVFEVSPHPLPDLHAGTPLIVTGRFKGKGEHVVRVLGMIGRKEYEKEIRLDLDAPAFNHDALPSVWARNKIERLSREMTHTKNKIDNRAPIKELALEYGLMSSYTSFVAVDSLNVTRGRHGTTVPVGIPVPKGVKYETTVGASGRP